jgi:threonine synthase
MIVLGTAHPAKFPGAIEAATGRLPDIPDRLKQALSGKEDFSTLDAGGEAVRGFIRRHSRKPALDAS